MSPAVGLALDHLSSEDRLEVELNGRVLSWDQAQVSGDGWSRQQAAPLFWASYPTRPVEQKWKGSAWNLQWMVLFCGRN